jgi:hypothetical protein
MDREGDSGVAISCNVLWVKEPLRGHDELDLAKNGVEVEGLLQFHLGVDFTDVVGCRDIV